jgi:hypothetical protein
MRSLFASLFLFSTFFLSGQSNDPIFKIGDYKKTGFLGFPDQVIASTDEGYFILRVKGLYWANIYIDWYDKGLELKETSKLKGLRSGFKPKEGSKILEFIDVNEQGQASVFYSSIENNFSILYRASLSLTQGSISDEQVVHKDNIKKGDRRHTYFFVESEDGNKRMVVSSAIPEGAKKSNLLVIELDESLKFKSARNFSKQPNFKVPFNHINNLIYPMYPYWPKYASIKLLNNGSLAILEEVKDDKSSNPHLIMIPYNGKRSYIQELDINADILDAKISPNGNTIVCSGFYNRGKDGSLDGAFRWDLNPNSGKIVNKGQNGLKGKHLHNFFNPTNYDQEQEGEEASEEEGSTYNHILLDNIVLEDSSIILVSERTDGGHYVINNDVQNTSTILQHKEIIFTFINKEGKIIRVRSSQKNQISGRNTIAWSMSGVIHQTQRTLHFVYSERSTLKVLTLDKKRGSIRVKSYPKALKYKLGSWDIINKSEKVTQPDEITFIGMNGKKAAIMQIKF